MKICGMITDCVLQDISMIGDALGCPVQFMMRDEIHKRGLVKGMEGYGTYNMPPGTWTDDSSMTLATLDSIRELRIIDLEDIMVRFIDWYEDGDYIPYGEAFDEGNTCSQAIVNFENGQDVYRCGEISERSNGNGSLMRIIPACLYAYCYAKNDTEAVKIVHEVSGLTHNHLRSKIGCGLYYFCLKGIIDGEGTLMNRLQIGLNSRFSFYEKNPNNMVELSYYGRLKYLDELAELPESRIKTSGYVVDSLEAAIWGLITTSSFVECELKIVNLGDDSDTVGAIAGGLAGIFYGYDAIPRDWLDVIPRREWIEKMAYEAQNNIVIEH